MSSEHSVDWKAIERDLIAVAVGFEQRPADRLVADKLFDSVDELHIRHLKIERTRSSFDRSKRSINNVHVHAKTMR